MTILIIGASRGLGRALADGLAAAGHEVCGVARTVPEDAPGWIAADLSRPAAAARTIAAAAPTTSTPLSGTSVSGSGPRSLTRTPLLAAAVTAAALPVPVPVPMLMPRSRR